MAVVLLMNLIAGFFTGVVIAAAYLINGDMDIGWLDVLGAPILFAILPLGSVYMMIGLFLTGIIFCLCMYFSGFANTLWGGFFTAVGSAAISFAMMGIIVELTADDGQRLSFVFAGGAIFSNILSMVIFLGRFALSAGVGVLIIHTVVKKFRKSRARKVGAIEEKLAS